MSAHDSVFGELLLHIFADNSSFNAGHHVVLVNPLDFVHPGHIHGHDGPLLMGLQHQSLSDVGSSSERNQHNVELLGSLDQELCLFVGSNIHDVIDASVKLGGSQLIKLLD
jgi:hypothetical protein